MCRFHLQRGLQIPTFLREKLVGGIRVVTAEAISRYSIKPSTVNIAVFLASDTDSQRNPISVSPWARVTSGTVDVVRLPGDHTTAFMLPNIDVFAQELRMALDAAIESPATEPVSQVMARYKWKFLFIGS